MSLIYDEMELEEFESVPDEDPQRMIYNAYRDRALLGYVATTFVAEADGQVVGVAFGYPDNNENASTEYIKKLQRQFRRFAMSISSRTPNHLPMSFT